MNMHMKRVAGAAAAVAAMGAVATLVRARRKGREAVHISANEAEFSEVVPGVSKCILWGDTEKGPYGTFTRFGPGHHNPLHKHSSDLRIVVLEGAYISRTDEGEQRVSAGEYFYVPAGMPHVSEGDAEEGCLFYEESQGGFDLVPLEERD
jgi:quercetin dioxygenase-like cupin family protein